MKKQILLIVIAIACLNAGCMMRMTSSHEDFGFTASPPVVVMEPAVEVEMSPVLYDHPVQGWYIEGHWVSGIWVAPFWTRDVMVFHQYFGYYHGPHRVYMQGHFNRYPERYRYQPGYRPGPGYRR